jgi:hypothetical protein
MAMYVFSKLNLSLQERKVKTIGDPTKRIVLPTINIQLC